uniref:Beta-glucanase n=1 Tax=Melittangium lichenicola TaxID=45 RepID=A0A3Q8I337_9BACT|nr:endo-beta-13-14 glucanase (licheninase) [Melittangium lichenicola]
MARDATWKRVALALLLTGCGSGTDGGGTGSGGTGSGGGGGTPTTPPAPVQTGAPPTLEWLPGYSSIDEAFDTPTLDTVRWRPSDGWANSGEFNAGWRADHVRVADGQLQLVLDTENCPGGCSKRPYASGELTTRTFRGYGRYEVRMKPVRTPGTMTAFAITTGSADTTRSDSIDLAILGRDTRALTLNYVANGGVRHDKSFPLPFDAADDFHTYGIEWTRSTIHWYVDDKRLHSVTGDINSLPTHPGRVLMNFWAGEPGATASWMGRFTYPGAPLAVLVDSVRYGPAAPVTLLEDFETPEKAALWKATVGSGAKFTARQSNQGHQGKSLYLTYTTSPTASSFTARTFETPQDWTGVRYVNFWFKGTLSTDAFRLELRDNGASADTAERFEYRFWDDFKGWKWVSVPVTAFVRSTTGQPAGAPADGLTLSGMWGLAFEPLSGSGHEVFIDDIELEH